MDREELAGWLRLAIAPGIGNLAARQLLAAFGLPQQVFAQSAAALRQVLAPAQVQALLEEPARLHERTETALQWLDGADELGQRRILTLADSAYPAALLNTEDPPLMLYLLGQLDGLWPDAIAMVGSRNPTPQGLINARQFARSFAQAGLTVVSGLALGIDSAAHEGALEGAATGGIATIAVVGTGLDRVYPRQNLALSHRIAQAGVLISEYLLGTPPLAENFPRRNRIISALSQGTVVVEAALRSGSLITARQAVEQGKEVFAIPGSIHSPQSRGCHALIKQGAKLVETALDVLEECKSQQGASPAAGLARQQGASPPAELAPPQDVSAPGSGRERRLLTALGYDPVSLDALVARTGVDAAELQAHLLELELAGLVARLPGGLFQRVEAG